MGDLYQEQKPNKQMWKIVQQSKTYETTGAFAAATAAGNGDITNQFGAAAPIPGVGNDFVIGPGSTGSQPGSTGNAGPPK